MGQAEPDEEIEHEVNWGHWSHEIHQVAIFLDFEECSSEGKSPSDELWGPMIRTQEYQPVQQDSNADRRQKPSLMEVGPVSRTAQDNDSPQSQRRHQIADDFSDCDRRRTHLF